MGSDLPRHVPRTIRYAGVWSGRGWTVKSYAVSAGGSRPAADLWEAARAAALRGLPQPARTWERHGIAVMTLHETAHGNQLVVAWWEFGSELRVRGFRAEPETPLAFDEVTALGARLDLWCLRVLAFEREAWPALLTAAPGAADMAGYVARTLPDETS